MSWKRLTCLVFVAATLSACGKDDVIEDQGPEAFYERGYNAMQSNSYPIAVQMFLLLEARYPFSPLARQAQLDLIYVYYRSQQPEAAIDAAEQFERENPTHPRVDYALYMKGLVYFDESPGLLERLFRVDMTVRPPKDTEQAFATFQELLRRFPDSKYAADARQRMVFLRNRLATYENHVARYYLDRGAYIAAIQRGQYALQRFAGAPQLAETLQLMIEGYELLGMQDLAEDTRRVLAQSFPEAVASTR
ncbi:MAG: outer membrane protein assembly factor BamD [Gammaproteobacteria bacterium]|jgi:outer membrane protein assembly factor BamD